MKLSLKMILAVLTALLLVATLSTSVFAKSDDTSLIDKISTKADATKIDSDDMTETAGKVLRLEQLL